MIECDNTSCGHNKELRCILEGIRLVKSWDGSENNWRLLCLNTTDKTYKHRDYEDRP